MSSDQVIEQAQEAIAHAHAPAAVEAQQPVASETPRTIPEANDDSIHVQGVYLLFHCSYKRMIC